MNLHRKLPSSVNQLYRKVNSGVDTLNKMSGLYQKYTPLLAGVAAAAAPYAAPAAAAAI